MEVIICRYNYDGQFKHPTKAGKVTVPGKMSDDLPTGAYKSILRQAGLEV